MVPANLEVGALLYPAYLRGQAYLLLHDGNNATMEFQKFLEHRTLVANNPLFALAHLGLARAYTLSGDAAKARSAYQDFLTLWKTPTFRSSSPQSLSTLSFSSSEAT